MSTLPASPRTPEKRKYSRIRFENQVRFQNVMPKTENIFEVGGEIMKARALDLSEDGICLSFPKQKPLSHILKFYIKGRENNVIEIYGRMIWTGEKDGGYKFIYSESEAGKAIRGLVNPSA